MKKNYAQGDQDLPNDFGRNSHDSLVCFLKQNKPIAPPPVASFETQLFAEISKYPQPLSKKTNQTQNKNLKRWWPLMLVIPVAIATGISFNWVNNRSQYQVASVNQISEPEQAAIEQSLISSWNVTNDIAYQSVGNSPDTQLLSELSPIEYE
jgi:hypothetical protein